MTMNYSPGPWEIDFRHGVTVGPARLRMPTMRTAMTMAQLQADARLIAAAPDMLEALKFVPLDGLPVDVRKAVRDAIAKAIGNLEAAR
jgi:hypothetical protein